MRRAAGHRQIAERRPHLVPRHLTVRRVLQAGRSHRHRLHVLVGVLVVLRKERPQPRLGGLEGLAILVTQRHRTTVLRLNPSGADCRRVSSSSGPTDLMPRFSTLFASLAILALSAVPAVAAQGAFVAGTVRDQTGGALPGVAVELIASRGARRAGAQTDADGTYRFDGVAAGTATAVVRADQLRRRAREVDVAAAAPCASTRRCICRSAPTSPSPASRPSPTSPTSTNPAENLVGIAQSASQGAITARQLDARPMMRDGRGARDRARRGHQPAQRRGQGEPVLTCAASTSITAPTSRRPSPACRSTCRRTATATATPISTS